MILKKVFGEHGATVYYLQSINQSQRLELDPRSYGSYTSYIRKVVTCARVIWARPSF